MCKVAILDLYNLLIMWWTNSTTHTYTTTEWYENHVYHNPTSWYEERAQLLILIELNLLSFLVHLLTDEWGEENQSMQMYVETLNDKLRYMTHSTVWSVKP